MGDNSAIEWTDATWNPTIGCTKVSEGCRNCYFMEEHGRRHAAFTGGSWPDAPVQYHQPATVLQMKYDRLDQPLRWMRPRRIFVNSLSDLFHKDVPVEFVDQVFAVMALARRHTFQILTKRPERMREYLEARQALPGERVEDRITEEVFKLDLGARKRLPELFDVDRGEDCKVMLPLGNVWLGTSVEDQKAADLRIPDLLETPAAVRFLSCEPLLGAVDLTGWGEKTARIFDVPETWAEYVWPDWVTEEDRRQVESFWGANNRRTPKDWVRDNEVQHTPAFGARIGVCRGWICKPGAPGCEAEGRWIHRWNNMGTVITDEGVRIGAASSSGPGWLSKWLTPEGNYRHKLHWVIAGGESGRGLGAKAPRPMHPDWARSLRDQCAAAGVAFHFKQWGKRCPLHAVTSSGAEMVIDATGKDVTGRPEVQDHTCARMFRVGKKKAGRLLDGRTHDEFPEVAR